MSASSTAPYSRLNLWIWRHTQKLRPQQKKIAYGRSIYAFADSLGRYSSLCLLDRQLRYIAANEKFASIVGAPLEELKDRPMAGFPPGLVELARRNFLLLHEAQVVPAHEITFHDKTLLASIALLPQHEAGPAKAVSVVLVDISAQKRLETELAGSNQMLAAAYGKVKAVSSKWSFAVASAGDGGCRLVQAIQ